MKKILIKKFSTDVKLPRYETKGSSGMDISAFINEKILISPKKVHLYQPVLLYLFPRDLRLRYDLDQVSLQKTI